MRKAALFVSPYPMVDPVPTPHIYIEPGGEVRYHLHRALIASECPGIYRHLKPAVVLESTFSKLILSELSCVVVYVESLEEPILARLADFVGKRKVAPVLSSACTPEEFSTVALREFLESGVITAPDGQIMCAACQ